MRDPLLAVSHLDAFYGDFQALFDLSLDVAEGEVVAIIGANGAGKSTLLKTIAGQMNAAASSVRFAGEDVGSVPAYQLLRRGIALVPEGRRLFSSLSVEENLLIGGHHARKGPWSLERVYQLFPVLKERRHQRSTSLSGGQQQMVAIGRSLMSNPRLLLCDEISLGLAPIIVREIYERLPQITSDGMSLIIVEQDVVQALKASRRVYCLQEGRVTLEGESQSISREAIAAAYFGA
jgi:branched-chain amino acid transport system ATP-binding protein